MSSVMLLLSLSKLINLMEGFLKKKTNNLLLVWHILSFSKKGISSKSFFKNILSIAMNHV